MKFHQLFKTMCSDTKIAIEYGYQLLPYKVTELEEDFLFYEEIKDMEVTEVWYSKIYGAIVIKVE